MTDDRMTGDRIQVRASDAEREAVVGLLGRHAAAGRLAPDELAERIEAALDARTRGELEALARDLPEDAADAATPGQPRAEPRRRPSGRPWPGPRRLAGAGAVGVAAAASGEPALLWALWPVLALGKGSRPRRRSASLA